jgi:hypothetical protein
MIGCFELYSIRTMLLARQRVTPPNRNILNALCTYYEQHVICTGLYLTLAQAATRLHSSVLHAAKRSYSYFSSMVLPYLESSWDISAADRLLLLLNAGGGSR